MRAIQVTRTARGRDETQLEREEKALVKFRFVCIIPEREVELAQAAIVLYHHKTRGSARRLKYTELHTMLGRSELGSVAWGDMDRNYNSILFFSTIWAVLVGKQPCCVTGQDSLLDEMGAATHDQNEVLFSCLSHLSVTANNNSLSHSHRL